MNDLDVFNIDNVVINLFDIAKVAFFICLDNTGEKDYRGLCQWEQSRIYWPKIVNNTLSVPLTASISSTALFFGTQDTLLFTNFRQYSDSFIHKFLQFDTHYLTKKREIDSLSMLNKNLLTISFFFVI
jgi:hypothetical protein